MEEERDASVVVPTIGRPELLRSCLESLARCEPRASELLVVDQSRGDVVSQVVAEFEDEGARLVECLGRGRGHAVNHGLREASFETVLITDDDCTVAPDWVQVGADAHAHDPDGMVTGRVLASGNPAAVPSTIDDPEPRDLTGRIHYGFLHAGNMVCGRSSLLAFGAFDERIVPSAEDNDLCYRWLRAGRSMRYEPRLVVWHHDWRTKKQLEELWVRDALGQGVFYGKHLRAGDLTVLRFLAQDLGRGARGVAARVLRGRPRWSDGRQGLLLGIPRGLLDGWSLIGPESRSCGESVRGFEA